MIRTFSLAMLMLALVATPFALAQQNPALHPHAEMNNWGKWGADDERGTANYLSPEAVVEAAKLIKSGQTFSLAIPIQRDGPIFPTRNPPHHFMANTGLDPIMLGVPQPGDVGFTDDYLYMALQGSTQWDALSHAIYNGKFYNGFSAEIVKSTGAEKLGIDTVKDAFVGRAVLIDVLRYKGGKIASGYGINLTDVKGALKAQGSTVKRGDIVIIRTGEVPRYYEMSAEQKPTWIATQTGIDKSVIPWLKQSEVAALAMDNVGIEQVPNADGKDWNLHGNLLRDLGLFLGEIWWLEELSDACAEDGRYEFFISAPPLNIPGAVGSPLNPIAIK